MNINNKTKQNKTKEFNLNGQSCPDRFIPDSHVLAGLPLEVAELFGKPHVGCRYKGSSVDSHTLIDQAKCCVCGKPATNCHHVPQKGMGGRNRQFTLSSEWGTFVLSPALLAVCGSGTTGCHNGFHGGARYTPKWVWDMPGADEEWWSGWLLSHGFPPHSERLFMLGHWEIQDKKTQKTIEIRG